MLALTTHAAFELLCKATGKWGLFISFNWDDEEIEFPRDILAAATYLKLSPEENDHGQILMDGEGIFLFDSEQEVLDHFNMTVGDDGPTKPNSYSLTHYNSYDGPARVFAMIASPVEGLLHTNT